MSFAESLDRHRRRHAIPASVPTIPLPAYAPAPLAPLPAARKRAFMAHLRAELDEAFGPRRPRPRRAAGAPPSAPPSAGAFIAAACATCRGACCANGGEHAYFDVDAIRRQREARPELTRAALEASYAAALEGERHAGSCVFHGAAGCVLPREMRGDLCNSFLCSELQRGLDRAGAGPALLVAATEQTIRRVRLHRGA
ncbi:MAG: hypothetical protein ACP5NP_05065 [Acetobacteraceae bacterium]